MTSSSNSSQRTSRVRRVVWEKLLILDFTRNYERASGIFVPCFMYSNSYTAKFFIKANFFTTSNAFAQMYQFSLNLNSLQQKISLMSNYLGTNSVVVKRVDCIGKFISLKMSAFYLCCIYSLPSFQTRFYH